MRRALTFLFLMQICYMVSARSAHELSGKSVIAITTPSAEEIPDMSLYYDNTMTMASEGKYPEALERFVWYFKNVLEYDPSHAGIRATFMLDDWKRLGEEFPPAMDRLVFLRDEYTSRIRHDGGNSELVKDVLDINTVLEQENKTIELFEHIVKQFPELARAYWEICRDVLFAFARYDLIEPYIGNVIEVFKNKTEEYRERLEELQQYRKKGFLEESEDESYDEMLEMTIHTITSSFFNTTQNILAYTMAVGDYRSHQKIIDSVNIHVGGDSQ